METTGASPAGHLVGVYNTKVDILGAQISLHF
jgi:hypothetical protein